MTRTERRRAYLSTRSYRRLSWRVTALMAVGALGSIILYLGLPAEIFPVWRTVVYWLSAWIIIWVVVQVLIRLTAGSISEEKLMKHVHEGNQSNE